MATQQTKVLPQPVDWDELYPGRFIKAGDFKGKNVTLKISEVKIEELVGDKGAQIKGVISFEKTDKQWALNKTNGICLKEMFGRKVQEWVGRRVTLFASTWDGEQCIRVYGSPDITEDKEVTVALPRKRPFKMTMHKTGPSAAPAAAQAAPGGQQEIIARFESQMRAAKSIDALEKTNTGAKAIFGDDMPIELTAAYDEMLEALQG